MIRATFERLGPEREALTRAEEMANTFTHGAGFVLSLVGGALLLTRAAQKDFSLAVVCGAYAASLSAVYLFSTLSHAVHRQPLRTYLRSWDQGVIYLLIAGTYSPFIWAYSDPGFRGPFLAMVWLAAAVGFVSKVFIKHRVDAITTITYVLLGWLPAFPLAPSVARGCMFWMALGGIAYTVGTLFLQNDLRVSHFHAVWHLMVVAASAFHWYAIFTYVAS